MVGQFPSHIIIYIKIIIIEIIHVYLNKFLEEGKQAEQAVPENEKDFNSYKNTVCLLRKWLAAQSSYREDGQQ